MELKVSKLSSFVNLKQLKSGSSLVTPRGYIPVAVGVEDETRRFMIHTRALCDSKFLELLGRSEEEYGFCNGGIIRIPYDAKAFEKWMNKGAYNKTFFRVSLQKGIERVFYLSSFIFEEQPALLVIPNIAFLLAKNKII